MLFDINRIFINSFSKHCYNHYKDYFINIIKDANTYFLCKSIVFNVSSSPILRFLVEFQVSVLTLNRY